MSSVSVGMLSPTTSQEPRFFIDAIYSKDMGATVDQQISIWTLVNDVPTLDWINLYAEGGEEETIPNGIEYKNGVLSVAEKHEFKTFTSCGSCSGRQMIRRIRILPDGVQDIGLTSIHPELDILDNLFERVADKQSTTEFASTQVVNYLRPKITSAESKSHKVDPHWFSVGMLGDFAVSSNGKNGVLCFQSDELGPLDFTLEQRADSYFVSHVSEHTKTKQCKSTNNEKGY